MPEMGFELLLSEIKSIQPVKSVGRICDVARGALQVTGLSGAATIGDLVEIGDAKRVGEVLRLQKDIVTIMPDGPADGIQLGDRVVLVGAEPIAPHDSWLGRVIDPFGRAMDGEPIFRGSEARSINASAPNATERRRLGSRLETGLAIFNTLLPIVRGQRIGLFAGSGVGKTMLLAKLARGLQADVVVIAMIGERGREVREFVERVLGPAGMKRAVVVAATSDQSPLLRRRCASAAMAVAEHFRDSGKQVLYLADSVTRFAEAHREVALVSGEDPSLRGFPPSTTAAITSLCERAGPGAGFSGDITAVFTVLVAGSDMDEPVADILRGVLDGHVVMDREIAERGRFPAIDLLRSVSRALPEAASTAENAIISLARNRLATYARAELMIQAGLYATGTDPSIDAAITCWADLDAFLAQDERESTEQSFARLSGILGQVDQVTPADP